MSDATTPDMSKFIRGKRKNLLFDKESLPVQLNYQVEDITKIIPHRSPLLFVDKITGLDREKGYIAGERFMDPDDPVFRGHFPEVPLYPGNFTLEMIGQIGLCLYYFDSNRRDSIAADAQPTAARVTKISEAYYLEPIYPGTTVTIFAQKLSSDAYFTSMIGQAMVGDKIAAVAIGEVIIL